MLLSLSSKVASFSNFVSDLDHSDDVENQEGEGDYEIYNYDRCSNLKYEIIADYSHHKDRHNEQDDEHEEKWLESSQKRVNLDWRVCKCLVPIKNTGLVWFADPKDWRVSNPSIKNTPGRFRSVMPERR